MVRAGFGIETLEISRFSAYAFISFVCNVIPYIQGDSEIGGNNLGTCSTTENKAKTSYKHGA
jgi:hypothetical protein